MGRTPTCAVAVLLSLCAGCSSASLSELRPGLAGAGFHCWLTLNFKKKPSAGDVRDVRVQFKSVVLLQDAEFDWAYITANDFLDREQKDWMGNVQVLFEPDLATTAESEPHAGMKVKARFELPFHESGTLKPGEELEIRASLTWAGKPQDSISRGLFTSFQKK